MDVGAVRESEEDALVARWKGEVTPGAISPRAAAGLAALTKPSSPIINLPFLAKAFESLLSGLLRSTPAWTTGGVPEADLPQGPPAWAQSAFQTVNEPLRLWTAPAAERLRAYSRSEEAYWEYRAYKRRMMSQSTRQLLELLGTGKYLLTPGGVPGLAK